jgi:hypothetical protein
MKNLSIETLEALASNGKTALSVETVLFSVEGYLRRCTFEAFLCAAEKTLYLPSQGVDEDLLVAGPGGTWWLERDIDEDSGDQVWMYREGYLDIDYKNAEHPPTSSQFRV